MVKEFDASWTSSPMLECRMRRKGGHVYRQSSYKSLSPGVSPCIEPPIIYLHNAS
jgi:hypothetical protein